MATSGIFTGTAIVAPSVCFSSPPFVSPLGVTVSPRKLFEGRHVFSDLAINTVVSAKENLSVCLGRLLFCP